MRLLSIIITLLIVSAASAQDPSLYKKKVFRKGKDSLNYRIMYPSKYDVNKKYPVILFLHGAGERGTDNEKQLVHGAKLFADSANRIKYPAFVIMPQCPDSDFWARIKKNEAPDADTLGGFEFVSDEPMGKSLGLVVNLIDSFAKTRQVNTKKNLPGRAIDGWHGHF